MSYHNFRPKKSSSGYVPVRKTIRLKPFPFRSQLNQSSWLSKRNLLLAVTGILTVVVMCLTITSCPGSSHHRRLPGRKRPKRYPGIPNATSLNWCSPDDEATPFDIHAAFDNMNRDKEEFMVRMGRSLLYGFGETVKGELIIENDGKQVTIIISKFETWMREVARRMPRKNRFHNVVHVADVAQAAYYLLKSGSNFFRGVLKMTNWECFMVIITAFVYDLDHDGHTNPYGSLMGDCIRFEQNARRKHSKRLMNHDGYYKFLKKYPTNTTHEEYHISTVMKTRKMWWGIDKQSERQGLKILEASIRNTDLLSPDSDSAKVMNIIRQRCDKCDGDGYIRPTGCWRWAKWTKTCALCKEGVLLDTTRYFDKRDQFIHMIVHLADLSNVLRPHDQAVRWFDDIIRDFQIEKGIVQRLSNTFPNMKNLDEAIKTYIKTGSNPIIRFDKEKDIENTKETLQQIKGSAEVEVGFMEYVAGPEYKEWATLPGLEESFKPLLHCLKENETKCKAYQEKDPSATLQALAAVEL